MPHNHWVLFKDQKIAEDPVIILPFFLISLLWARIFPA